MLYTGPGAAALTGRRGRNLTVIMQARFAEKLIVQSGRFNGNESGTAGICKIYIPSLKGKNAFERRDFYFVRFSGADKL